jgi:hypothetical protein
VRVRHNPIHRIHRYQCYNYICVNVGAWIWMHPHSTGAAAARLSDGYCEEDVKRMFLQSFIDPDSDIMKKWTMHIHPVNNARLDQEYR